MDDKDKIQALIEKPFEFEEHGFLEKGGYYILKSAIRQRLNEINPKWRNTPPEILLIEEDLVTMRGGLILFNETRYAVGTGIIERTRYDREAKKEVPLGSYQISRNKAKAMKTAARDLLPRAALEHGIGDYIRDMPKKVREGSITIDGPKVFKAWLDEQHTAWGQRWPQHWALNGGGKTVSALMTAWGIQWPLVASQVEPDKVLTKMSDTSLSLVDFIARLGIIKAQMALDKAQQMTAEAASALLPA